MAMSQIWAAICFCTAHELNIFFAIFKQLVGGSKEDTALLDMWKLYESIISVSVQFLKVQFYWNTATRIHVWCLWLLSYCTGQAEELQQEPYSQQSPKNTYYLTF